MADTEPCCERLRANLGEILYAVSRSGLPRRFRWYQGQLEAEGIYEDDPDWVVIIGGQRPVRARRSR
jgi:hypothetical protein